MRDLPPLVSSLSDRTPAHLHPHAHSSRRTTHEMRESFCGFRESEIDVKLDYSRLLTCCACAYHKACMEVHMRFCNLESTRMVGFPCMTGLSRHPSSASLSRRWTCSRRRR